jgi:hypothetical protein
MKPRFLYANRFHAELTRRTQRTFLFRRPLYRCRWEHGFALRDRDGTLWRPAVHEYDSDGASIPHPLDWLIPALAPLRYQAATMGIHDPACRDGELDRKLPGDVWRVVPVGRSLADSLLAQGVEAEGGWRATQGVYWLGVRIGSGFRE